MRHKRLLATCFVVILLTAGSGWLHGRLVNRWGNAKALEAAAKEFEEPLPERCGYWRRVQSPEMEPGTLEILQSVGHLQGVYSNDQTGESVVVQLIAGPSGPTSAHTPEICYAGQEYSIAGERKKVTVVDRDNQEHSFWQIHAMAQHIKRPDLEVLYAWSDGGAWNATSGPRIAYGGLPVLYKLQLARATGSSRPDRDVDPASDFLSQFIAEVQRRLVKSSRLGPVAQ